MYWFKNVHDSSSDRHVLYTSLHTAEPTFSSSNSAKSLRYFIKALGTRRMFTG